MSKKVMPHMIKVFFFGVEMTCVDEIRDKNAK